MTYGTHTTPIARYIDDIDFTFETQNDGSCFIKVIKSLPLEYVSAMSLAVEKFSHIYLR